MAVDTEHGAGRMGRRRATYAAIGAAAGWLLYLVAEHGDALIDNKSIRIALGTWLFVHLAAAWLAIVLGGLVIAIVLMDRLNLFRRLERVSDLRSGRVATVLAASSGMVGTVSGGGTLYFLAGYLKLACPTPEGLRGTNLVVSGLFLLARIPFVAVAGLISVELLAEGHEAQDEKIDRRFDQVEDGRKEDRGHLETLIKASFLHLSRRDDELEERAEMALRSSSK